MLIGSYAKIIVFRRSHLETWQDWAVLQPKDLMGGSLMIASSNS